MRLLKIFEYLWLFVAAVSLILGIREMMNGGGFNHYFIITILLALLGLVMFRVKRSGRKSTEAYYQKKQEQDHLKSKETH